MISPLINKKATDALELRIKNLRVDSKPKWGVMNATEMLLHLTQCNKQILNRDLSDKPTTLKQFFIRLLALYVVPDFPKNLPSEPMNITVSKIA